jgi:integrase/recombinase XerD
MSAATAGTVNPLTGKMYLDDRYTSRTVRHSNAVVRAFYDFWIEQAQGPLVNRVRLRRSAGPARETAPGSRGSVDGPGADSLQPEAAESRPRALSDD